LILNVEIVEAKDLEAKDANGKTKQKKNYSKTKSDL